MAFKSYVALYEPPADKAVGIPGIVAAMRKFVPMIPGRVYAFDFDGDVDAAFGALKAQMESGAALVVMEAGATQYGGRSSDLINGGRSLQQSWLSGGGTVVTGN